MKSTGSRAADGVTDIAQCLPRRWLYRPLGLAAAFSFAVHAI
jgi:hypothetical protein